MNTDELINAHSKLCGTRAAIESAENVPQRFKAVIDWQSDLAAFVLRFPQVIPRGIDEILAEEERKRTRMVLKAFQVKCS